MSAGSQPPEEAKATAVAERQTLSETNENMLATPISVQYTDNEEFSNGGVPESKMSETLGQMIAETNTVVERDQMRKRRRTQSAAPTNHRPRDPNITLQLPTLDLPAAWRPLRDDLVKHMQELQEKTVRVLGRKMDWLMKENELLRFKVSSLESTMHTHQLKIITQEDEPSKIDDDLMSFEDQVINPSTAPSLRRANHLREPSKDANGTTMPNLPEQEAQQTEEASHFHWMKNRFTECFGLPTDMYKRRNLISFDGVMLAKGYSRVVVTWQGMFFELRDEDINFKDLEPGFNTAQGCSTLTT